MSKRRRDKRLQASERREWHCIKGLNKISFWEMDPSTISQEIRYKPHFLGIYKTGRQNWGFWGEINIAPREHTPMLFISAMERKQGPRWHQGAQETWDGVSISYHLTQEAEISLFTVKLNFISILDFSLLIFIQQPRTMFQVWGGREGGRERKKKEITINLLKINTFGDLTSTRIFSPHNK